MLSCLVAQQTVFFPKHVNNLLCTTYNPSKRTPAHWGGSELTGGGPGAGAVGRHCSLLEVSHRGQEGALGLYFHLGDSILQQFSSFSKHSVQYATWGCSSVCGGILNMYFQTIKPPRRHLGLVTSINDKVEG